MDRTLTTVNRGHHPSRIITPDKLMLKGRQRLVSTISVSNNIIGALVHIIRETLDQVKLSLITWGAIHRSTGIDPPKALRAVKGADLDAVVTKRPLEFEPIPTPR